MDNNNINNDFEEFSPRCVFIFGRLTDKTEPPGAKVQTDLIMNLIYQVFPMV